MKADPGVDELIFSDEGKAHAGRRPVAGSLVFDISRLTVGISRLIFASPIIMASSRTK